MSAPLPPTLDQRLALRARPAGPPVMHQRWEALLFLHWQWEAATLQALLPPGLTLDTHEGTAWLGVVPFFMRRVRPHRAPALPWLSDFPELNVRTYVHDATGRAGVWFFSLDCPQPIAVTLARRRFHLPYQHARISANRRLAAHGEAVEFTCTRRVARAPTDHFVYAADGPTQLAVPGTLEFFLTERYLFFSYDARARQLYWAQVAHEPYRLAPAAVARHGTGVLTADGLAAPLRLPDHVLFAPGFPVEAFALTAVPAS